MLTDKQLSIFTYDTDQLSGITCTQDWLNIKCQVFLPSAFTSTQDWHEKLHEKRQDWTNACMFLVLFNYYIYIYYTRSNFSLTELIFVLEHKLLPGLQQRLQAYGKMFTFTTDGIVLKNIIL